MGMTYGVKLLRNSGLGIPFSLKHSLNLKATIILAICVLLGKNYWVESYCKDLEIIYISKIKVTDLV